MTGRICPRWLPVAASLMALAVSGCGETSTTTTGTAPGQGAQHESAAEYVIKHRSELAKKQVEAERREHERIAREGGPSVEEQTLKAIEENR
jgi:hypothetical protein